MEQFPGGLTTTTVYLVPNRSPDPQRENCCLRQQQMSSAFINVWFENQEYSLSCNYLTLTITSLFILLFCVKVCCYFLWHIESPKPCWLYWLISHSRQERNGQITSFSHLSLFCSCCPPFIFLSDAIDPSIHLLPHFINSLYCIILPTIHPFNLTLTPVFLPLSSLSPCISALSCCASRGWALLLSVEKDCRVYQIKLMTNSKKWEIDHHLSRVMLCMFLTFILK